MGIGNTIFKKRESHQAPKMQLDYFLVRKDQIKFVGDRKVPSSEACIIQHKHWYVTLPHGKSKTSREGL